jgi:hypothetical protein
MIVKMDTNQPVTFRVTRFRNKIKVIVGIILGGGFTYEPPVHLVSNIKKEAK